MLAQCPGLAELEPAVVGEREQDHCMVGATWPYMALHVLHGSTWPRPP